MERRLLGFFSGFPSRRFPRSVAERLARGMACRESLVFVSAWPEDYRRNDSDSAGMYEMFLEYGMDFSQRHVVDRRMEPEKAARLVREASCVFLMGGHPGLQMKLIRDAGLDAAIWDSASAVLGVSAGAINMAKRSLDTKESPVPYEGLGLAGITVKPHFVPGDQALLSLLLSISMELPICAMEDNSAIFAAGEEITPLGSVYWIAQGKISPFSPQNLLF
ncbi:Type 1 glutamine amidotransferase-like domain-containing protein [Oscillospiraceae bacterium 42-9]